MFLKAKISLLLAVLGIILVSVEGVEDSTKVFAQDATRNADDSARREGAIVEGQSDTAQLHSVICAASKEKVPTLGIRFSAVNSTQDLSGWWNIPGAGSGNNAGGHISHAMVQNRTYELRGTMDYDYLCGQKGDLNYGISITGKCGLETVIRYSSSNEVSSHDFKGHVNCH
jgi:hypothetical protein